MCGRSSICLACRAEKRVGARASLGGVAYIVIVGTLRPAVGDVDMGKKVKGAERKGQGVGRKC